MGREIRMVPPNWEHPKYDRDTARYAERVGSYIPLYDKTFEDAAAEWKAEFAQWEAHTHPDWNPERGEFWEWHGGPPDSDCYRPAFTEDPTWLQVYETVSEGTPVTPPFATREELVDYLVSAGGHSREAATALVSEGWAPSMVITGGKIYMGIDASALTSGEAV